MNSAMLVIHSKDRVAGTNSQYDINIPPALDLSPYSTFYVESVAMRGGSYDITSDTNIFWCAILTYSNHTGAESYSYDVWASTVPPGSYSGEQMAIALTTAINSSFSSAFPSAPAVNVSVAFDSPTNRMIVTCNSATYRAPNAGNNVINLWFAVMDSNAQRWPGMPFSGSLNEGLGFVNLDYPGDSWDGINSFIGSLNNVTFGSDQICYQQMPQLLLCTSWSRQRVYITDSIDERATAAVVTVPAFGGSGVWETAFPLKFNLIGQDLKNLSIWWRDTEGRRAEFGSSSHAIVLRFE